MQVNKRVVDGAMSGLHTIFIYFVSAYTQLDVAFNTELGSVY
jgi:hypothetical protein